LYSASYIYFFYSIYFVEEGKKKNIFLLQIYKPIF